VWDLTRLVTQTALGDFWVMLAGIRGGVTGAKELSEKTSFEYDEELVDGEPYLKITVSVEQQLACFKNFEDLEVALSDDSSFQRIELELRVKAADLGGSLKNDSLEVVSTTVHTRMVPDPTQLAP
jgi:hypothetical protein